VGKESRGSLHIPVKMAKWNLKNCIWKMAGGVVEVTVLMEHKRRVECVQSVFYITMELSQWNSLILLK
jgi:hypothetical protein